MKKVVPIFQADIIDKGILKVSPPVKREMALYCMTFKPGTRVDITIRKHSEKRSDLQNQYYWGVVIAILADHFGYDPESCHDLAYKAIHGVKNLTKIEGYEIGNIIEAYTTLIEHPAFTLQHCRDMIRDIRKEVNHG